MHALTRLPAALILTDRIVDDTGLFPPEELDMASALARHRSDQAISNPVLSQRFVCPAGRFDERHQHLDDGDRIQVIALGPAVQQTEASVVLQEADDRTPVVALETSLPVDNQHKEQALEVIDQIAAAPPHLDIFVEVGLGQPWKLTWICCSATVTPPRCVAVECAVSYFRSRQISPSSFTTPSAGRCRSNRRQAYTTRSPTTTCTQGSITSGSKIYFWPLLLPKRAPAQTKSSTYLLSVIRTLCWNASPASPHETRVRSGPPSIPWAAAAPASPSTICGGSASSPTPPNSEDPRQRRTS